MPEMPTSTIAYWLIFNQALISLSRLVRKSLNYLKIKTKIVL
jgi:hypothetical protein